MITRTTTSEASGVRPGLKVAMAVAAFLAAIAIAIALIGPNVDSRAAESGSDGLVGASQHPGQLSRASLVNGPYDEALALLQR